MTLRIVGQNGATAQEAVKGCLDKLLKAVQSSGKLMQDGLLWTTRNHFQTIYPGSSHYSPNKVNPKEFKDGQSPEASIVIDVPGVTRAYHDMHIRPKFRKHLTIPMHRSSYGKSAKDFSNLIYIKKKNGTELLAQKTGGGLIFLFVLKDYVFQKKDSRLMPSDETFADNIFARISAHIDRAMKN